MSSPWQKKICQYCTNNPVWSRGISAWMIPPLPLFKITSVTKKHKILKILGLCTTSSKTLEERASPLHRKICQETSCPVQWHLILNSVTFPSQMTKLWIRNFSLIHNYCEIKYYEICPSYREVFPFVQHVKAWIAENVKEAWNSQNHRSMNYII